MKINFNLILIAIFSSTHSIGLAAAEDTSKKTRLRADAPVGTFQTYRYTQLTDVLVKVKNVGSIEAQDIQVVVVLPNGKEVSVSGPSSLAVNQTATYSGHPYEVITSTDKLSAKASCSNCYK